MPWIGAVLRLLGVVETSYTEISLVPCVGLNKNVYTRLVMVLVVTGLTCALITPLALSGCCGEMQVVFVQCLRVSGTMKCYRELYFRYEYIV